MPLITVKLVEGAFSETQKQEIVRKLTDAMGSIDGQNLRRGTWVLIEELNEWGESANPMTVDAGHHMTSGITR
jgi:4-oxalocrotonate tautomerase